MSIPSPKRSLSVAPDIVLAAPRRADRQMPPESVDDRAWRDRVAREALHQELIEATFDRAEAYERLGDFERALESLDRAVALGGELPQAYRVQRDRCLRAASRRRGSATGARKEGLTGRNRARRA
jgi:tetratricopeptide (TPR) repeat protein